MPWLRRHPINSRNKENLCGGKIQDFGPGGVDAGGDSLYVFTPSTEMISAKYDSRPLLRTAESSIVRRTVREDGQRRSLQRLQGGPCLVKGRRTEIRLDQALQLAVSRIDRKPPDDKAQGRSRDLPEVFVARSMRARHQEYSSASASTAGKGLQVARDVGPLPLDHGMDNEKAFHSRQI